MRNLSLEDFSKMAKDINNFNLFIGAGISRDAPTSAPIWSELQAGFLDAVYEKMVNEKWPISDTFTEERINLKNYSIRPELFWREMINILEDDVIFEVLNVVGESISNKNHKYIATLLNNGRCKYAITTNFDEYIEKHLAKKVIVSVLTDTIEYTNADNSIYYKLHGSLSVDQSLSYTLEQYDKLEKRNKLLFNNIDFSSPLIVAGYSGCDTDVLPSIRDSIDKFPYVVIVKHPGSPDNQPILSIGGTKSSFYIVESKCSDVLSILCDKTEIEEEIEDTKEICITCRYKKAVRNLKMHLCPVVLLVAYHLNNSWNLLDKYATLTDDALDDDRYKPFVTDDEWSRICYLVTRLNKGGVITNSHYMMHKAVNKRDDNHMLSGHFNHIFNQSIILSTNKDIQNEPALSLELLAELLNRYNFKTGNATLFNRRKFLIYWQDAKNKAQKKEYTKSINSFTKALEIINIAKLTYLDTGHFFLDLGSTLYDYGTLKSNDEILESSSNSLLICIVITKKSGDLRTNTSANRIIELLEK